MSSPSRQVTADNSKCNPPMIAQIGSLASRTTASLFPQKPDLSKSSLHPKSSIFKDVCFCFPVADADLSWKLIEIIKKQILTNGGELFEIGMRWPTPTHYYLVSSNVNMVKLKKTLTEASKYLLQYTYIKECLAAGCLLSIDKFLIQRTTDKEESGLLRRKTLIDQSAESDDAEEQRSAKASTSSKGEISKRQRQPSAERAIDLEDSLPKKQIVGQETASRAREIYGICADDDDEQEGDTHAQTRSEEDSDERKYWDDDLGQFASRPSRRTFSQPLNEFLCLQLTRLKKIYDQEKDVGRSSGYRKALEAIRSIKREIRDERDIMHVKHIGPKITQKIIELIETGKMRKLERYRQDDKVKAIDDLCLVWGIGPAKAMQLYKKGVKSLEDLRKNQESLTKSQRMGLKYIEEFRKKINWEEVNAIQETARTELFDIAGTKERHFIEACGAYRRKKEFCSDIVILMANKDGAFEKEIIFSLISRLKEINLITDHLTIPNIPTEARCITYMGVCRYEQGNHRRIDIKYYPLEQFPYALLYLTGSDYFNKSMRLYAKKKGYSLTDCGLMPIDKKYPNPPKCQEEKDIFAFLGLEYMPPEKRVWELPTIIRARK